ncbi:unnamed protein product [Brassicogethes aeneus]|uniref:Uncharacterized protein n=1 Tax=Brassicogethes aeneus TaxID=1431903 RepID=A0A9P0B5U3_BRAAE|nr:unnamed protein product [Brassicogethes aeneus]
MALKHELPSENSRTALVLENEKSIECKKFPQFFAAFIASLSALCMGMSLSWSSPAIPMLQKTDSFLSVTATEGAWIGSLITLGACLGAICTGSITALLGPKKTLLLLSLPLYGSWILIAYCDSVWELYIARFVAGISCGGFSVATPTYIAELSHHSIRGTLGTFFQFQITIGLLIEYILGGLIKDFQLLAQVSSIFPIIFVFSFLFMPESPAFLCKKGQNAEFRKSLQWFRGEDYDIEEETSRIRDDLRASQSNKAGLSDLINDRATLRALIICLGLMLFQQLSGINAVLFYAGEIFEKSGSSMSPDACAILLGSVQVLATFASTILIDKAGRKILLLTSDFVMCLSLLSLGTYFYTSLYYNLSSLNVVPLISVATYIVFFSMGLGPIPWMMVGELFPPKTKPIASSISACLNWTLAFTVTNQFQNMVQGVGIGITFGVFGIVCALGSLFVAMLVPETKGKTSEEIACILAGENGSVSVQGKVVIKIEC